MVAAVIPSWVPWVAYAAGVLFLAAPIFRGGRHD